MEVVVMSDDREFIRVLGEWKPAQSETSEGALDIDEPTRTPGMAESWFEIVAVIGVPAIPVSVAVNLLSSWIWSGLQHRPQSTKARVIVRTQAGEVQVEISGADDAVLRTLIETAFDRADSGS